MKSGLSINASFFLVPALPGQKTLETEEQLYFTFAKLNS